MADKKEDESIQTVVADAASAAIASVVDESRDKPAKKEDEEKLDDKAELFVRRVTDSVTKAIADMLKPPTKESESSDEDEDEPTKRKRKTSPTKPKAKSLLDRLF